MIYQSNQTWNIAVIERKVELFFMKNGYFFEFISVIMDSILLCFSTTVSKRLFLLRV